MFDVCASSEPVSVVGAWMMTSDGWTSMKLDGSSDGSRDSDE